MNRVRPAPDATSAPQATGAAPQWLTLSYTRLMTHFANLLAVAAGGAIGAVGRYLLSGWISNATRQSPFPYGTLSVNLIGAITLGFIMAAAASGRMMLPGPSRTFVTIGVLGAFTTFSTFSYETVHALRLGDFRVGLANIASSLVLCLL